MVLIMAALLSLVVTLVAAPAAAAADCRQNDFSYPFGIGPGSSQTI
jgi:hypothetical protein